MADRHTIALSAHKTALAWSMIFAGVHLYWAAGGTTGLPSGIRMRDYPALLAVDLAAIPLCLTAACLVWPAARLPAFARAPKLRRVAIALVALLCLAHALPPLLTATIRAWTIGGLPPMSEREAYGVFLYEPYWLIGGVAFGAAFAREIAGVGLQSAPLLNRGGE